MPNNLKVFTKGCQVNVIEYGQRHDYAEIPSAWDMIKACVRFIK